MKRQLAVAISHWNTEPQKQEFEQQQDAAARPGHLYMRRLLSMKQVIGGLRRAVAFLTALLASDIELL